MALNRLLYIIMAPAIFFFSACSITQQVPGNDALYTGAEIKLQPADKNMHLNIKDAKAELGKLLRPQPNSKFLGIRLKLRIYNMVDTPKRNRGITHWLKYKAGEPPVLASEVNPEKNRAIPQNRLENIGFFHTVVRVDTTVKNKKMAAVYSAVVQKRYVVRNIFFPSDSGQVYDLIRAISGESKLIKDKSYNLEAVKNELGIPADAFIITG